MYYIGLMSGTSMDAIDAVLVRIQDRELEVIHYLQLPVAKELQQKLRELNSSSSIHDVTEIDVILGKAFANAVMEIIKQSEIPATAISAIGSHGQTILHLPDDKHRRTLQIGDGNIIAYETGITTVTDFRRLDMAAGGQGAPLAPAYHQWQFHNSERGRIVLNIGGMANITILPAAAGKEVTGFDTGPGNALMDDWTQRHLGEDYDKDGQWAASGTLCEPVIIKLMYDPYFKSPPPKSTGKDYFNLQWLDHILAEGHHAVCSEDIQATLLELSARTISDAISNYAATIREVLVCGGGIHNRVLMQRLEELLPGRQIVSTAEYGINPDAVEAITFAWLAKQRIDGVPANIPSVTGARHPVLLGAVYEPASHKPQATSYKICD